MKQPMTYCGMLKRLRAVVHSCTLVDQFDVANKYMTRLMVQVLPNRSLGDSMNLDHLESREIVRKWYNDQVYWRKVFIRRDNK